jgi:MoaA/NifB/PqqE/SkfB family radical SAM enzyme
MCSRNDFVSNQNLKGCVKYLPLEKNIEILDRFVNLKHISFIGIRSESTLYKNFIPFLKYIKGRNITVDISTNATARSDDWWKELGETLDSNDSIKFAIDGSTQEIYEKYRRGGNLNNILNHHHIIKDNSKCKRVLQFVMFSYNQHDLQNIIKLKNEYQFDDLLVIPASYTIDNREDTMLKSPTSLDYDPTDFSPPRKIYTVHKFLEKYIKKNNTNLKIECTSYKNNSLFINHMGGYSLCCHHNGYMIREKTFHDNQDMNFINNEHMTKVINGKYDFCRMYCTDLCKKYINSVSHIDGILVDTI